MDDGAALDYLAGIENPLILVLDSIEDPRNYGACLRTAEGAGVDLVARRRIKKVAEPRLQPAGDRPLCPVDKR